MPRIKSFTSLQPVKQKIFSIFRELIIDAESKAVTPREIVEIAQNLHPDLFPKGLPAGSGAAAIMIEMYRAVKGLHRVRTGIGPGYKYFFNPDINITKNAPRRSSRRKIKADVKVDVKVVKADVKVINEVTREVISAATQQVKIERPVAQQYLTLKKEDGTFAGVVSNGVLYESLESFAMSLNSAN